MYTSRQNFNQGSHWLVGLFVGILLISVIISVLVSIIFVFADNPGIFLIVVGVLFLYFTYDKNTTLQSMTPMEFVGISIFSLLTAIGVFLILIMGFSFQSFSGIF